jgi:LytS/YehU family sensor histidine kinase
LMVEKQREKEARNAALKQRLYRTGLRARRIELEMMKQSIQPHFLINTLAAIRAWLLENPSLAGRLLDDFSEEMRMIQTVAGRPKIPLSIELALCRRHLNVMEMRRENRYSLKTRGLTGEESIPPLIFHTMIENAFTHAAARHGDLRFYLWKRSRIDADRATLITHYRFAARGSDTAREESKRKGAGTGLRYIKVRLQEAYPGGWSVQHGQTGPRYLFEIRIEEPIGANSDR